MPKVSVIIPVYRVEQYIEKCASSLFAQTLDDIEFVFVNDCSPDKSIEIINSVLEGFPHRNKQVLICHQPVNSGLSAARTLGLQYATGDYIIHCDSDDWVDECLYESMYNKAVSIGADIVMCYEVKEYPRYKVLPEFCDYPSNPREILQNLRYKGFGFFVHNKMVKRCLYTDNDILPYPKISMWEDVGLVYRLMYYAKSFAQIDDYYYHYNRSNITSMTYSNYKGASDMIQCVSNLTEFVKARGGYLDYADGLKTLQYISKLELISTNFNAIRTFEKTFPESDQDACKIDRNWFSKQGRIRLWFVVNHLSFLFVFLFKIYDTLDRVLHKK